MLYTYVSNIEKHKPERRIRMKKQVTFNVDSENRSGGAVVFIQVNGEDFGSMSTPEKWGVDLNNNDGVKSAVRDSLIRDWFDPDEFEMV